MTRSVHSHFNVQQTQQNMLRKFTTVENSVIPYASADVKMHPDRRPLATAGGHAMALWLIGVWLTQVHVRVSSGMRHGDAAGRVVQGRRADDARHDRLQGRPVSTHARHRRTCRLGHVHVQGHDGRRHRRDHRHRQGQRSAPAAAALVLLKRRKVNGV